MFSQMAGTTIHIILSSIFVKTMGIKGTALSCFISYGLTYVLNLILARHLEASKVSIFNKDVYKQLGQYFGIGFPGFLVTFLDWTLNDSFLSASTLPA